MEQQHESRIPVHLARAASYDESVFRTVGALLDAVNPAVRAGDRVLVKPNMLRADKDGQTCTDAAVVAAACVWLRDRSCRVMIGDSPGFGTARGIARVMGLPETLSRAGCGDIPIRTLDGPVMRPLRSGGRVGISRHALDADHILNLPKLKAHVQMRVTSAVKNLFGCVSGVRKAFLHSGYGDREEGGVRLFPSAVVDIMLHLPPVTSLADAITAMHVRGPSGGKPYHAGLLGASVSPVALDTVLYDLLEAEPEDIPVWRELRRRNIAGAFAEDVLVRGEPVSSFDFTGFHLPAKLAPETFNPLRLLKSTLKRLLARVVHAR